MPTELIILGIAALAVIVIILGGFYFTRRESLVEARINRLEEVEKQKIEEFVVEESQKSNDSGVKEALDKLTNPFNERLENMKMGQKVRRRLARADLKLTVAEYAVSHVISVAGFFTLGYLALFPNDIVMSTVAALFGFFFPRIYVGRLIGKRLHSFEAQLPDTLSLWVNALRSGYSVLQAMEAIAKDAPEPTMTEFQRVVREVQIGIDMPDALDHLLERIESEDLDLVVTAVNIQREVGGNLAEILETISGTIRERIKLKGEIRVLTSQGRMTGGLISFLPIVLALFLNGVSPAYMGQMFESRECGWPMLGAGLALIGMGSAVIQKIVDIEI